MISKMENLKENYCVSEEVRKIKGGYSYELSNGYSKA